MIARGSGFMMSAGLHGGLLLCALVIFGAPQSHDAIPEQTLTVDIVPPAEAPKPPTPDKPQQKKSESAPAAPQSPPPQSAPQQQQAGSETPPQQSAAPPQQTALSDQLPVIDTSTLSTFNLRLPTSGFDSKADKQADLARDTIATFRAQLKRCWQLPAGLSAGSRVRVVIRVFLSPDGALAAEPTLIEAPASADGPAVMQAAMRALNQCQPFATLPRDRYKEWRVLDIGFSPREMAGG